MVKLHVDGQTIEVQAGTNLLHAVLSADLDLPYFCWHPELGSLGACRQCAVVLYRDDNDTQGRLAMACMTQVADNMRISITAQSGVDFRAGVVEYLMRNHPHDCPVCEEGGECHLQDMTVMTGHTARHYNAKKRTFNNQQLGPFVNHEMNRCITCYRCVRFYRDYAGGTDLQAMGSRDRTYFGRAEDGVLENVFAGNLVEVCPTGVFTDKPFSRSYTRKWDLQSAPSICNGCSVGCNISASERYGKLKRVHNRYHSDVNGYFLCDRGRFGFHYINAPAKDAKNAEDVRLRQAGKRNAAGAYDVLSSAQAVAELATLVRQGKVVGVGSPRAALETNYALRALVGAANFSSGLSAAELALNTFVLDVYRSGVAHVPTLTEMEKADAVLVLGEDVLQTAPRIALALRQAVRNVTFELGKQAAIPAWQDAGIRMHGRDARSPLYAANVLPTDDADIATGVLHAAPDDLARVGVAIAQCIDGAAPPIAGKNGQAAQDAHRAFAESAATALAGAKRPLIVAGTSLGHMGVLQAARAVAEAVRARGVEPALCFVVPECNSLGATLLADQGKGGMSVDAVLDAIEQGQVDTLVVAENDLFRRAGSARVRAALTKVRNVVALDTVVTGIVENANLVLPAAAFAESEGTYVNFETRAQRFYQVFQPEAPIAPSWRWLSEAAAQVDASAASAAWQHVDDVVVAMDAEPGLSGVIAASPNAAYRPDADAHLDRKLPRQPHRYSGRTAMNAKFNVHEPKQPVDAESPLAFSMEGTLDSASPLLPYVWTPGWNSNQAITRFQKDAGGELKGGTGGVRLINHAVLMDGPRAALPTLAGPTDVAAGQLRAVPLWRVFGSDELSSLSGPIIERAPRAFVVLNTVDAGRLGLADGEDALVDSGDGSAPARLRVLLNEHMAAGHAGYACGMPGSIAFSTAVLRVQADPSGARVIARA